MPASKYQIIDPATHTPTSMFIQGTAGAEVDFVPLLVSASLFDTGVELDPCGGWAMTVPYFDARLVVDTCSDMASVLKFAEVTDSTV